MTTATYSVSGMTCDHCVRAVTEELNGLGGVSEITIDLLANGITSRVTVTSDSPLADAAVADALDEAGGYELAAS